MKNTFKHHHHLSVDELQDMWKEAYFVFDTNVLLQMYKQRDETVKDYLSAINQIKEDGQLWMPYQIGKEFYDNRLENINKYDEYYKNIKTILENTSTELNKKFKEDKYLDLDEMEGKVIKQIHSIIGIVKEERDKHPDLTNDDHILQKINDIYEGCIGNEPTKEEISKIEKEGELRYKKSIPPGYKDKDKTNNKFGDLVIWKQLIQKGKYEKRPIIFITNDGKEDWWLKSRGKTIMPQPSLKKEMLEEAGVKFHIYTLDKFMEYFKDKHPSLQINESTIKEMKRIRKFERSLNRNAHDQRAEIKIMIKEIRSILYKLELDNQHDISIDEIHYLLDSIETSTINKILSSRKIIKRLHMVAHNLHTSKKYNSDYTSLILKLAHSMKRSVDNFVHHGYH